MAHRWKNDLTKEDVTPYAAFLNRRQIIGAAMGLGAVAMAEWPMTPAPPVRLTTLKGWPRRRSSRAAIMRPVASVPPPAPQGTIIVTGRVG